MENLKMSNVFQEYHYKDSDTVNSPVIPKNLKRGVVDYSDIVKENKGKTSVNNKKVIDMDRIKDSLHITPTPSSKDVVFVGERNNKDKFYFLIDFKFDVSSPREVCKNIDDKDIRKKYSFTRAYIQQNDIDIRVYDTAFFVFKNKDFEIVKNSWMRRKLNSPKNVAVKQSDFEIVFEQNEK